MYTLIPAAYISQLPMKIIEQINGVEIIVLVGAGVIYLASSVLIFNKAIKVYGSGNTLTMRM